LGLKKGTLALDDYKGEAWKLNAHLHETYRTKDKLVVAELMQKLNPVKMEIKPSVLFTILQY